VRSEIVEHVTIPESISTDRKQEAELGLTPPVAEDRIYGSTGALLSRLVRSKIVEHVTIPESISTDRKQEAELGLTTPVAEDSTGRYARIQTFCRRAMIFPRFLKSKHGPSRHAPCILSAEIFRRKATPKPTHRPSHRIIPYETNSPEDAGGRWWVEQSSRTT
jgi:hypothetical protein